MADTINLTSDEAMAAVFAEFSYPAIEDDEFTEKMYSERYDMPIQTANNSLHRALKAGKVTRRYVICNERRCWGYRFVAETR